MTKPHDAWTVSRVRLEQPGLQRTCQGIRYGWPTFFANLERVAGGLS